MSNPAHLRVIEGTAPSDALIGQTVDGRYLVEGVLGEGGMGLVYRARHVVLGKLLAMKVLRHDVSRDEEIITRFRQEAQSASSIGNQHIIDISDFGVLRDGSTYFIMEYLDGVELTKAIERHSPIPFPHIAHVVKQLCDALGAAHLVGIVHRDLKPDNVYLIRRGQDSSFVKVLDFGIAKVGGSTSKLTRAGQVFGTPHYMSPEQCAGTGVDHRTDIYAIGVMLYEMVTGRVPFDSDNLMGILSKHLYEAPTPPSQLRPDCPPAFEAVILRCLAKLPEHRYQHCSELADDIARLEVGVTPAAMSATVSQPHAPGAAPKTSSKKPLVLATCAVAVIGALGAGLFAMSQQSARDAREHAAHEAQILAAQTARTRQLTEQVEREAHRRLTEQSRASAKIRLTSEPSGAEVYEGDAFLGVTPLEITRPSARLELELRHVGYEPRRTMLSELTTGELNFALVASRGAGTQRARDVSQTGRPSNPAPQGHTQPAGPTDILNPWGH